MEPEVIICIILVAIIIGIIVLNIVSFRLSQNKGTEKNENLDPAQKKPDKASHAQQNSDTNGNLFASILERYQQNDKKNVNHSASILERYVETYHTIIESSCIRECQNHRPLTAALLLALTFIAVASTLAPRKEDYEEKVSHIDKIENYLKKELSDSEFAVFVKAMDIFTGVTSGEIVARGDWRFKNEEEEDPFQNLFDCYGDLLRCPGYLENYSSAPLELHSIDDALLFAQSFFHLFPLLPAYLREILPLL